MYRLTVLPWGMKLQLVLPYNEVLPTGQMIGCAGQAMENISNMNRMQKTLDTMKKNGYEEASAY